MLKSANSATSVHDILGCLFDMFFGEGFADPEVYRRSVENIFQVPYFYYSQIKQRGAVPANDTEPLSFEAITWCYRIFLLREPESVDAVMRHLPAFPWCLDCNDRARHRPGQSAPFLVETGQFEWIE
jgi:hypothetical protein